MRAVAAAVVLALATPALAADVIYPRVVRRGGEVCVQSLDAAGAVVEQCRPEGTEWSGGERARPSAPPALETEIPAAPSPAVEEPLRRERVGGDPAKLGRLHAQEYSEGSKYFWGGITGGALLGPGGLVAWPIVARTSDPIPPALGQWDNQAREWTYRRAFREEARDIRTTNAIVGGLVGTAIFTGLVFLLTAG